MLAKVTSGAVLGLDACPIEVEVDIASKGFPTFNIVGLPDKAIEEAKERVRSALRNCQAPIPDKRITVNLSPADLPKRGPAYDFPISLGIYFAEEELDADILGKAIILGELSLDGSLRHTPGVLPIVLMAKEKGFEEVYLPALNAREAAVVSGITIYPVADLKEMFNHLRGVKAIEPFNGDEEDLLNTEHTYELDFKDILGQEYAKRAMVIAAAGGHNITMTGPAGSGKTLLARALPSILPPLTPGEALEVTKISSINGSLLPGQSLVTERPFRSPHHTVSRVGLIGGGSNPLPGEISMAHRGILFLDELPEFPRHVLEALRQPVEDGVVTVSRARLAITFPANFMLVTAQNPCPCGNFGSRLKDCTCTSYQVNKYAHKVSGPLLDRIDLHVEVPAVDLDKLTTSIQISADGVKGSAQIRQEVVEARQKQTERFKDSPNLYCNADMKVKDIKKICVLGEDSREVLKDYVRQLSLSARSYHKLLKVARTIADLEGEESILPEHLSEAIQYRMKE